MNANRTWIVSVRSKKNPHRVEAENVKEDDQKLVLRDAEGKLTGSFNLADVEGYSVEPAAQTQSIAEVIRAKREKRLAEEGVKTS